MIWWGRTCRCYSSEQHLTTLNLSSLSDIPIIAAASSSPNLLVNFLASSLISLFEASAALEADFGWGLRSCTLLLCRFKSSSVFRRCCVRTSRTSDAMTSSSYEPRSRVRCPASLSSAAFFSRAFDGGLHQPAQCQNVLCTVSHMHTTFARQSKLIQTDGHTQNRRTLCSGSLRPPKKNSRSRLHLSQGR